MEKTEKMKFVKMSATGNDFILFDNRKNLFKGDERDYFHNICQRRFSVGADGVILLEKSNSADFKYRHFNPDGYPVKMCGNGARAICKYAFLNKIAKKSMTFETEEIIYNGWCFGEKVTIDHPKPLSVRTQIGIVEEEWYEEGGFVVIGVPHMIIFSHNIQDIDVYESGQKYRYHPFFNKGTNVNFVEVMDTKTIQVRTYERGIEGETFACGTGAMASAVISHISKGIKTPVTVLTRGGELMVKWDKAYSRLYLTGGADLIFEGQFK